MTQEELQALWARLDERMLGLTRSVDHLSRQLESLATKADVESRSQAIHERIDRVEMRVSEQGPRSIWKVITEVAVGVAALAGASGIV